MNITVMYIINLVWMQTILRVESKWKVDYDILNIKKGDGLMKTVWITKSDWDSHLEYLWNNKDSSEFSDVIRKSRNRYWYQDSIDEIKYFLEDKRIDNTDLSILYERFNKRYRNSYPPSDELDYKLNPHERGVIAWFLKREGISYEEHQNREEVLVAWMRCAFLKHQERVTENGQF